MKYPCLIVLLAFSVAAFGQLSTSDDVTITVNATPPSNPCVTTPLGVTVTNWPSTAAGSRQFRYTASQVLMSFAVDMNLTRATFTDTRGCTVVVTK